MIRHLIAFFLKRPWVGLIVCVLLAVYTGNFASTGNLAVDALLFLAEIGGVVFFTQSLAGRKRTVLDLGTSGSASERRKQ